MTDINQLIERMSPEFRRENQDGIDEILFDRLQNPESYEGRSEDAHHYGAAIILAAFWIGLGLAIMGFGIGGHWK